jgi:hypothetical protein
MTWSAAFNVPIVLPDGRARSRHCSMRASTSPRKEHSSPEWQAAMEALILVAEGGGPTMFARISIMRALNRHHVPEFNPKGKEPHWGRRKLKRDQ